MKYLILSFIILFGSLSALEPLSVDLISGQYVEKTEDYPAFFRSCNTKHSALASYSFAKGWYFQWDPEKSEALFDEEQRLIRILGANTCIEIIYCSDRIDLFSNSGDPISYYLENGLLLKVCAQDQITEYSYKDGKIVGRKDPNGASLRFNYSHDKIAAIELSFSENEPFETVYQLAYLERETKVKNALDQESSYYFEDTAAAAVYYQNNTHPIEDLQCFVHKKMEEQGGLLYKAYLTWRKYSNMDSEHMLLEVFGETNLMLLGYYSTEAECGKWGGGEVSNKVRVSFINGILTNTPSLVQNLSGLSKSHGDVNIHYVYRPTKGWSWDLFHCLFVELGHVSPYAIKLTKQWRQMIAEMGGINGGGKIIHYAHSIGTIETLRALELMSSEERKLISVYAFGSPSLFTDVPEIQHYASVRDGVSLIDVPRFIQAYFNPDDPVYMSGTLLGIPLADHLFSCPTYRVVWTGMGETFVRKYGRVKG